MKRNNSIWYWQFLQLPLDFLSLLIGFVWGYKLRVNSGVPVAFQINGWHYFRVMMVISVLWIVIFYLSGLYDRLIAPKIAKNIFTIINATLSGIMMTLVLDFFSNEPLYPSKKVPIYAWLIITVLIITMRFMLYIVRKAMIKYTKSSSTTIIIGHGAGTNDLKHNIETFYPSYKITQFDKLGDDSMNAIIKMIKSREVAEIYQTNQYEDEKSISIINTAHEYGTIYKYVPTLYGIYSLRDEGSTMGNIPIVELLPTSLFGQGRIIKRGFDIIFGTIAIILAIPIMLIVAIVIKITDPGPILYRHKRVGRGRKTVYIVKFRSMKAEYSDGEGYQNKNALDGLKRMGKGELFNDFKKDMKLADDPRCSSIGKIIRKLRIDELPQLFWVIKGDLSLVGPRAVMESELERYGGKVSKLMAIKPGLTGLWQISGPENQAYSKRVLLDSYYVENWSMRMDIMILIKTILKILSGGDGV